MTIFQHPHHGPEIQSLTKPNQDIESEEENVQDHRGVSHNIRQQKATKNW